MKNTLLILLAFIGVAAHAGNMTTKLVVDNPKCFGSADGSIQLYVFGGTPPFVYTWDSGLAASSSQYNLSAGTYSFTVSDNTGDVLTGTVVVAQPGEIQVTPVVTDVSGPGADDGAIGLTVTGGTGMYSFNWSNAIRDRNISSLTAGFYTVQITDAVGCSKNETFQVKEQGGMVQYDPQIQYEAKVHELQDIAAKQDMGTGIAETKQTTVVYPNPASSSFHIAMGQNGNYQILLMNVNGQVVAHQNQTSGQAQMDVSSLANGSYILSVRNGSEVSNQVVSIQK